MSKKAISILVVLCLGLTLLISTALAAPQEISVSLITPPKHLRNLNVINPWVQMIEEKTGGKVKITVYYASALAPPPQTFDSVVKGIADVAEGIVFATPGRFPLTETVMLPDLGLATSQACSKAIWEAYKSFPALQKEFTGAKVLWLHVTPATRIITREKPIHKMEDLKGLKLHVSGTTAVKTAKALGFTPVQMDMGELYLALEKGVIDGVALPSEILVSRRLGEVTKYVTDIDLGHDAFFVTMNQGVWDSLEPDVKKVFEELSGDWAVDFTSKAWDKFNDEAVETNKTGGIEYITLAPEEVERWKAALAPVKEEYAADLEAKGLPGKQLLDFLQDFAK